MLEIIIIDNEQLAIVDFLRVVENDPNLKAVGFFKSVAEAMGFLCDYGRVDMIFCDISMPDIDGIAAAKMLKPYTYFFVFITGYQRFLPEANEVMMDGFLLKPVLPEKLALLTTHLLDIRKSGARAEPTLSLFVKADGGKHRSKLIAPLELRSIARIRADANYCYFALKDADKEGYWLRQPLKTFHEKYGHYFLRVNRSELVAKNYIRTIEEGRVYLQDGYATKIEPAFKKDLFR